MSRPLSPDAAKIRQDITDHYLAKREGSAVKEIAPRVGWSESKVRKLLDTGAGIDGITSREEGRDSFSKSFRMMQSGVHKIRIYYPTLEHMAGLVKEARAPLPASMVPPEMPDPLIDPVIAAVCRCIEWCCPELAEVTARTVSHNWRRYLHPAPDGQRVIGLPLSRADAWTVLRALAVANSVPDHYDEHRNEERPRTWIAERLLRLVDPATDPEATVSVHCTGGCGDMKVPRVNLETGRCPQCGRDIDIMGATS